MSMDTVNSPKRKAATHDFSGDKTPAKPGLWVRASSSDILAVSNRIVIVRFLIALLDILFTAVGMLLLMPVFMILALTIKLDSPGSVLFKQKRVGMFGREFWFYKFRSMVTDAEARQAVLLKDNEASGPLFKMKNDPRVTCSGRILRKYSLDELPQLINVIKRDMSLVGPRPALPKEVALYNTHQLRRLEIKPGITGLWQVSGRSDLSFERAIELDIEYIERQSVWLYVIILVRTIPAVILGRGAY